MGRRARRGNEKRRSRPDLGAALLFGCAGAFLGFLECMINGGTPWIWISSCAAAGAVLGYYLGARAWEYLANLIP